MEKISLQKIKWLRSLQLKKNRDKENLFVIEGEKIFSELYAIQNLDIRFILCSERIFHKYQLQNEINAYIGGVLELEKASSLNTAPEIIVVVSRPDSFEINLKNRLLVLDGIQDPGNLGTIIRTADWFGINQIICSKNTVDCYNSKVIQSSMGSIFRVSIVYKDLTTFLKDLKLPIHGALLNGVNLNDINPTEIKVLVLGNEGQGISPEIIPLITHPTTIPGFGNAESLNVAIAGGIFMNHWRK